uniref:Fungal-type protein kinase domain-containing protein n=1 Tax=Mycena chlorophos TaxID=658473 RepID=A0ABQ0KW23_MYCCL|nr:predicted protein [Mycena chlorophos]
MDITFSDRLKDFVDPPAAPVDQPRPHPAHSDVNPVLRYAVSNASESARSSATGQDFPSMPAPIPIPSYTTSSHESDGPPVDIHHLRAVVARELHESWVIEEQPPKPKAGAEPVATPPQYLHDRLVADLDRRKKGLDRQVRDWLEGYPGYDSVKKRWKVPASPKKEDALYEPLKKIMSDIVAGMGNHQSEEMHPAHSDKPLKTRHVALTANTKFVHETPAGYIDAEAVKAIKSCPDIGIFGTGPCGAAEWQLPQMCTYANMYDAAEIKLIPTLTEAVKQQICVYAHQILVHQHNRNFVRIPIITHKDCRVVHFDRGGVHASAPFNYHTEEGAVLFTKLVYLMSSLDEQDVGYDTSIFWENGARCIQVQAPCKWNVDVGQWQSKPRTIKLQLVRLRPIFFRRTIRARGTKCWIARDTEGHEWYVKDYWMSCGRTPESDFLKDVRGGFGVAELHAWQDTIATVFQQRGREAGEELLGTFGEKGRKPIDNRSLMRMVLKRYRGTLNKLSSALLILLAIRDVVRGHQHAFLKKNILHQDVSFTNILLTTQASKDDEVQDPRAALIDFDMAVRAGDENHVQDKKTGTKAYQSGKILLQNGHLGLHDVLDDLESVFYVLCYVCYAFDRSGRLLPDMPDFIAKWMTQPDGKDKQSFILLDLPEGVRRFRRAENAIVDNLFQALQKFFESRTRAVIKILRAVADLDRLNHEAEQGEELGPDEIVAAAKAVEKLQPKYPREAAESDYNAFFALLDAAIAKLRLLPPPTRPSTPATPQTPSTPSPKRARSDEEEVDTDSPNGKKARRAVRASGIPVGFSEFPAVGAPLESSTDGAQNLASTSALPKLQLGPPPPRAAAARSTQESAEDTDSSSSEPDDPKDSTYGERKKKRGPVKRK